MTEQEIDREVKRRLAIFNHAEEVTGNVAMTCRYYGITRQTFYTWKRRYEELGEEGLKTSLQTPQGEPQCHPRRRWSGKIIYLRKNYHFGPAKISMYLKRYHDVEISNSGVWRILKRLGHEPAADLPALQAPRQALEALREATPWPPGPDRREVHRADQGRPRKKLLPVHRHRRLHPTPGAADLPPEQPEDGDPVRRLRAREAALRRRRSSRPTTAPNSGSSFHYHLLDRGVGHTYIRPRTPASTARSRGHTGSTPRSSTASWTEPSSTTPRSSTTSSRSGRTTTTTIGPTAASTARRPTND